MGSPIGSNHGTYCRCCLLVCYSLCGRRLCPKHWTRLRGRGHRDNYRVLGVQLGLQKRTSMGQPVEDLLVGGPRLEVHSVEVQGLEVHSEEVQGLEVQEAGSDRGPGPQGRKCASGGTPTAGTSSSASPSPAATSAPTPTIRASGCAGQTLGTGPAINPQDIGGPRRRVTDVAEIWDIGKAPTTLRGTH